MYGRHIQFGASQLPPKDKPLWKLFSPGQFCCFGPETDLGLKSGPNWDLSECLQREQMWWCSVDKGLHIKSSSYWYHVINSAYTPFIRLTVKLCIFISSGVSESWEPT